MKSITFADERGESLVEILMSVAIMSIVLGGFLAGLSTGALGVSVVRERVTAENIARLQLEYVKETGFIADADHYVPTGISDSHPGYTAAISATTIDTGLQLITVTVFHNGETLFTIANYKANQE